MKIQSDRGDQRAADASARTTDIDRRGCFDARLNEHFRIILPIDPITQIKAVENFIDLVGVEICIRPLPQPARAVAESEIDADVESPGEAHSQGWKNRDRGQCDVETSCKHWQVK